MSDVNKMEFLISAPVADACHPEVQRMARFIEGMAQFSRTPAWTKAHLCHAVARDCVSYQTDVERVGREQIDGYTDPPNAQWSALACFVRGADDCDAKARLFVALARACGLDARLEPYPSERHVRDGEPLSHVYASVALPARVRGKGEDHCRMARYPVETILARAVIGDAPKATPREVDGECAGRWLYP